jgi:diguanylate cyclase (GGDEF)-like protein
MPESYGPCRDDLPRTRHEKNRRILVIDDMPSTHEHVRAILNHAPAAGPPSLENEQPGTCGSEVEAIEYEVDSAYQGEQGYECVVKALEEGRPYAMAIVDVRMPGWDGIKTVEQIRRIDSEIQIAICSAYADKSWQAIHKRFGANDWLLVFRKPLDLAEVQQFVCAMTEKWNLARCASYKVTELERIADDHARQLRDANVELETRNNSLSEANARLSQEIEARRQADDQIRHIAFHDTLTNLPNRAFLMDRLDECIERSKRQPGHRFAVLFTDVDDFKIVNDSLGHRVGDQLLSQIAMAMIGSMRTLQSSLRPAHDTVARLGGDEFIILLEDIKDASNAEAIAHRLRANVCKPMTIGNRKITPSISIGVAVSHNDHDDSAEILRDADAALYHAKAEGKGRVAVFDQAMRSRAIERLDLENDLKLAIEQNQFEVYYQPIVSLTDGRIDSLEALLRWQHPVRGLVLPETFLAVAEQMGLTEIIGELVLHEVTNQLANWRTSLPFADRLAVSLNLAAGQLVSGRLMKQVEASLRRFGLPASCLRFELTETTMMENLAVARKAADEIIRDGFDVCLDDFGTGYSSLSILHTLPFSAIKLDRSFIGHLTNDVECPTTIQAIVMMAKNRNMQLIAEGVETYEQVLMLRDLDCELGQGFFFSKPMPGDMVEGLFNSQAIPFPLAANHSPERLSTGLT